MTAQRAAPPIQKQAPTPTIAIAPSEVRWSELTHRGRSPAIRTSSRFSESASTLVCSLTIRNSIVLAPMPPKAQPRPNSAQALEYAVGMILEHRAAPPFFKNGFVIGCEETREGAIIDPGDEVDQLLEAATHHGLSIKTILLTHAHLDHVTGVARAK